MAAGGTLGFVVSGIGREACPARRHVATVSDPRASRPLRGIMDIARSLGRTLWHFTQFFCGI